MEFGEFVVGKTKLGPLSTSLTVLLVLLAAQFLVGMALNLLVIFAMPPFPASGTSFTNAFIFVSTGAGGNLALIIHFIIDMSLIAAGAVNLAFALRGRNLYKVLSLIGFISVLSAFVNGVRFVASNYVINGISYGMAAGFISAFVSYFVMAMLMYRDLAVEAKPST